jgi:DNA-binding SARP family transcriptional activator/tetratricopeptide (TPR) repeat protein
MLRLTTLGAMDLRDRHGHPVRDVLAQPKRVSLLVFLAVEGRRGPVSRDRLLALFWPESDEARARNTLSQALHHLRQALGSDVIASHGANAVELLGDELWCDATAFTEALDHGDVELALDLYRGEFCPTLFVSGAPGAEEWVEDRRRELRGLALAAARTHAERLADKGEVEAAARAARRALALQPDEERDVRSLLALLDRCGDGAGALLAYQEYARRLATSLETEPASETRQLVEAIRRRREGASRSPLPEADAEVGNQQAPAPNSAPVVMRPPPPRWLGPAAGVVLALVVVLLMVGGVFVVRRVRHPARAPAKAVAVFPFAVRGGADLAFLRDGMVDLLSAKLDGAVGLHAIDPRSVIAATAERSGDRPRNAAEYARIARALGAGWFIGGEVVEVAGRLQLSGVLYDLSAGSAPVAAASVSGQTATLFALVDDLAGRILAGLTTGRDTTLTRLAAVTTHSLPALKAFLQGEQALRAGLDAQAASAFLDAATLDTLFALAQYRLALTGTWVSVPEVEDPTAWAAAAARHARRLTPLVRDLLWAYRAYREVKADSAERMYRGIVEGHPDNVEAWLMLGETLFHLNMWRGRPPYEARPAFERVLVLDPTNVHAAIHLARLAAAEGRAGDLDSIARRYFLAHHEAERTIEMRALREFLHGDAASRAAVSAAALRSDFAVAMGVFQAAAFYAQDLAVARELAAPIVSSATSQYPLLVVRRMATDVALEGGRWGDEPAARLLGRAVDRDWLLETHALIAADPFFPVTRSRVAALRDSVAARRSYPMLFTVGSSAGDAAPEMRTYLLGLLSVRLGDRSAASRYASELMARGAAVDGTPDLDLAHGLRAEIARGAGNLRGALAELEAFAFVPPVRGKRNFAHWGNHERFLRAELLHALGRDREALQWYESFLGAYDLPWIAAAHLRMGEIHEQLGDRERAAFHYGRVAALWHEADPEFQPLVARAGLARSRLGPPT